MNIAFNTAIIDGEIYISSTEIARTVTTILSQEAGEPQQTIDALKQDIKANLIALHVIPKTEPCVVRRGLEAYADKTAFYALAVHYNWPESVSQPVLAALGEYGLDLAQKIQQEMSENTEVAA